MRHFLGPKRLVLSVSTISFHVTTLHAQRYLWRACDLALLVVARRKRRVVWQRVLICASSDESGHSSGGKPLLEQTAAPLSGLKKALE